MNLIIIKILYLMSGTVIQHFAAGEKSVNNSEEFTEE